MDHEEAISIVQITFFLLTLFEYFLTMNLGRQEIEQEGYLIFSIINLLIFSDQK